MHGVQAVVSFSYDLLCGAAVAFFAFSFNFSVNGIDIPLQHQCSRCHAVQFQGAR